MGEKLPTNSDNRNVSEYTDSDYDTISIASTSSRATVLLVLPSLRSREQQPENKNNEESLRNGEEENHGLHKFRYTLNTYI